MKLYHFAKTIKADVDDFTEMWIERSVKAPCEWPFEMNDSEWLEHLLVFIEGRHEDKTKISG